MKLRLLMLAGAWLLTAVVPNAQAASHSCAIRGSLTLAATAQVRIYTEPKRNSHGRVVSNAPVVGRTFGCRYRSGRAIPLGTSDDRILGSFHIAGNFVGFNASGHQPTTATEVVEATDLARAKLVFRERVRDTGVSALVISDVGSLAWIRNTRDGAATLAKFEPSIGRTVLDPGPEIGAHSLAIGGPTFSPLDVATVYWTTPAGPRSAPLRR